MKKSVLALMVAGAFVTGACTRVETGHVGVRTDWSGNVEMEARPVGWHQTLVGHITQYVSNVMTIDVTGLTPQTHDKSSLKDLDIQFTYSVEPSAIPKLVTTYKGRDMFTESGAYPIGNYVAACITTAANDVVSHYDALDANNNREKIRAEILAQVQHILADEKLDGIVKIHQMQLQALKISDVLQASAANVIKAENDLKTKDFEVQTAKKEAERLTMLAANVKNIDYMNAKANGDIAEAVKEGKVEAIVVPYNFNGILNLGNLGSKK